MVIIDGMKLPPKKIMMSIFVLILLMAGTVAGYLYKQKVQADKLRLMQQQKVQREANDRNSYEATVEAMFNSAGVDGVFQLYDKLLKDFSFLQIAGWKSDQVLCEIDSCNVRFTKMKDRKFEYITIKKGDKIYEPIFNQDDMTYQSINYEIDKKANSLMKEKMGNLLKCNDFVSGTYQLISLLVGPKYPKQQLIVQLPNPVFNFSQQYDWATYANIKRGFLNYKTPNFYTLNYIKDKFSEQFIVLNRFMVDKEQIDVSMSFYCL